MFQDEKLRLKRVLRGIICIKVESKIIYDSFLRVTCENEYL